MNIETFKGYYINHTHGTYWMADRVWSGTKHDVLWRIKHRDTPNEIALAALSGLSRDSLPPSAKVWAHIAGCIEYPKKRRAYLQARAADLK